MKSRLSLIIMLCFYSILYSQEEFKEIEIQTINYLETKLTNVLKNEKDKPVILFSWSNKFCGPCIKIIDDFNENFYEKHKLSNNLKFIALNIDSETDVKNDEIKKKVIEKSWLVDVYIDPNGNYKKYTGFSDVPQIFLIINNKIIFYKNGGAYYGNGRWSEETADYINYLLESLDKRKVYFDEKWDYCNEDIAAYVRTIDKLDTEYEVQDRWISGELQMKGLYSDKFLTEKNGTFTYFHKNGKKSNQTNYIQNKIEGKYTTWFDNGQIDSEYVYENGLLKNVLAMYDKLGNKLNFGDFENGNGFIISYDKDGKKTSKMEYKNSLFHGKYIQYDENEKVKNEYEYSLGNYVKTIK